MSPYRTLAAMVAAFLVSAIPAGAMAADSTVQLILGGEAYDGPPRFEVSFDGKILGEAAVDAAIDTASAGRFADVEDRTAYVQSFDFTVPDDVFKPGGEVRVRLVNEAYGGDGSNRDRNLFLAAVAVNGRAVTVSGLTTQGTSAETENELLGEFLVLRDGNVEGVSLAPNGGWPLPGAEVAVAAVNEDRLPVEVAEAPASKAPAAVQALKLPAVEARVETASLAADTQPTASAACNRDELYNVIGFNENSNDVTPRLMERLDQIVADIGPQKCRVLVTGYSSKQGNHATNALFAIERAQNVLAYLKQAGLQFDQATATGGGGHRAIRRSLLGQPARGDLGRAIGSLILPRERGRINRWLSHLVEIGPHRRRFDVLFDEGLADAAGQDEGQRTAHDLLVLRNGVHQVIGVGQRTGNVGEASRQSGCLQMLGDAAGVLARRKPQPGRKAMCQHHADGDAFAMQQPVGIAGGLFERVAEGVAEIQQGTDASFLLVGEDEPGLGGATASDHFGAQGGVAGKQRATVFFQPEIKVGVVDQPIFHHLGIAGGELPFGQGGEGVEIGKDQLGLVEGTDQILAVRRIDTGLAADGAVHLGQ